MRGKSKGLDARSGSWAPKGGLLSWAVVNIFLVDVVYSAERVRNSDTPKQPEHCVAVDGVEGVLAAIQQGAQQICMDNARDTFGGSDAPLGPFVLAPKQSAEVQCKDQHLRAYSDVTPSTIGPGASLKFRNCDLLDGSVAGNADMTPLQRPASPPTLKSAFGSHLMGNAPGSRVTISNSAVQHSCEFVNMLHILPLLAKRVPDPPGMLVVTGAVTTFGNSRAAVVARFLGSPAHLFPGAVPGNAGVTLDYSNATVWCGPSATDATEARSRAVQSASVVLTGPEAASVTEYARTLHPDLIRRWHGGRPPLPLLTVADLPKEVNSSALPSSDPRAVGVAGGPITGEPRKKEKKVVEQWLVLCLLGLVGAAVLALGVAFFFWRCRSCCSRQSHWKGGDLGDDFISCSSSTQLSHTTPGHHTASRHSPDQLRKFCSILPAPPAEPTSPNASRMETMIEAGGGHMSSPSMSSQLSSTRPLEEATVELPAFPTLPPPRPPPTAPVLPVRQPSLPFLKLPSRGEVSAPAAPVSSVGSGQRTLGRAEASAAAPQATQSCMEHGALRLWSDATGGREPGARSASPEPRRAAADWELAPPPRGNPPQRQDLLRRAHLAAAAQNSDLRKDTPRPPSPRLRSRSLPASGPSTPSSRHGLSNAARRSTSPCASCSHGSGLSSALLSGALCSSDVGCLSTGTLTEATTTYLMPWEHLQEQWTGRGRGTLPNAPNIPQGDNSAAEAYQGFRAGFSAHERSQHADALRGATAAHKHNRNADVHRASTGLVPTAVRPQPHPLRPSSTPGSAYGYATHSMHAPSPATHATHAPSHGHATHATAAQPPAEPHMQPAIARKQALQAAFDVPAAALRQPQQWPPVDARMANRAGHEPGAASGHWSAGGLMHGEVAGGLEAVPSRVSSRSSVSNVQGAGHMNGDMAGGLESTPAVPIRCLSRLTPANVQGGVQHRFQFALHQKRLSASDPSTSDSLGLLPGVPAGIQSIQGESHQPWKDSS